MRYEIIGHDEAGRPACFEVVADSMEHAIEIAAAQHLHVERVTELGEAPPPTPPPRRAGLGPMTPTKIVLLTVGVVALIAMTGVMAVIAVVPVLHNTPRHGPPPPGGAYFYDTASRTYFIDAATKIPPIVSPEGNAAIRAHFFTCGDCSEEERFLGYYEKYALDVKDKIESNPESMHFYEEVFQGRFYCPPGDDPTRADSWVAAESPQGFAIAQRLQQKCPARKLRYCPPPR